jgi:hypothetical protein
MANARESYTDLIGEALLQGLGPVEGVLDPENEAMQNIRDAAARVIFHAQAIDWKSRAPEPPRNFSESAEHNSRERKKTAEEHARDLIGVAFDDAQFLLQYSEYAAARLTIPYGVSLGRVLLSSERTLLSVARLKDRTKDKLFNAITHADLARFYIGFSISESPLNLRVDNKGQPLMDWIDPIRGWIRENTANGGCPAHTKVVEFGKNKMTLMHFFWDKLVRASYEV